MVDEVVGITLHVPQTHVHQSLGAIVRGDN